MGYNISGDDMKYIDEVDIKNKTVIVRVDYNVPIKDKKITDDFRIISSMDTINYLLKNNCKIILLSHLGKVKTEEDKIKYNMKIVYDRLKQIMNCHVYFSNTTDGEELDRLTTKLKSKEIILVQNTRYEDLNGRRESNCDEELSKYWASLGDVFVMDAFGSCHREHASTYGISKYLPTCYGFLIKKEVTILDELLKNNNKTLILGGAKVSDKIDLIDNLINKSNKIIIGGKMCFTFLYALGYKLNKSLIEEDKLEYVKKLLNEHREKLILPSDFITEKKQSKDLIQIKEEDNLLDIGRKTIKKFEEYINPEELIIWNGPMGYIEESYFEHGTIELLKTLRTCNAKTIITGGDTAGIANKYRFHFYHISTGGGATLNYLEGKELKVLEGKFNETNNT